MVLKTTQTILSSTHTHRNKVPQTLLPEGICFHTMLQTHIFSVEGWKEEWNKTLSASLAGCVLCQVSSTSGLPPEDFTGQCCP